MTMFWLAAAVMLLVAVAFVVWPLVRQDPLSDPDQDELNLGLARERLQQWRIALEKELISQAEFDVLSSELEDTLILELDSKTPIKTKYQPRSYSVIALAVVLPIVVIGIYLQLGTSIALLPENSTNKSIARQNIVSEPSSIQVEELLAKLQDRLATNPNDERGWSLLAHTFMSFKRYTEAAQAYKEWLRLTENSPDVLVLYANALAMAAGGNLADQPTILLEKALAMDPLQPQGLWLSGIAARERGDLKQALVYWYRLKPLLVEQHQSLKDLQQMIAQVETEILDGGTTMSDRQKTWVTGEQSQVHAALNVRVGLDPKLLPLLSDSDVLFVYARAAGIARPIAAIRRAISPWPIDVVLDDASSVMATSPLSSFDAVEIGAHISRSGEAMAKTGDLVANPVTTPIGNDAIVQIKIFDVLP